MNLVNTFKQLFRDIALFAHHASGLQLRQNQQQVARALADSVIHQRGLSFVVIFPRQSGKNELQAQLETYLLALLQLNDAEIVKISPTWKPQSLNAMRRLERVLTKNLITRGSWSKEQGYIYRVGQARIFFLSGGPGTNIVGATASTLLECDEAQDVQIEKWDKDIAPMAASTNATKVFWGTAWTSQTLLAREKRAALEAQKLDGRRRVFHITADDVRLEAPAYGRYVDGEIFKLGRQHPFVRTQFFSEEIDEQSGMFPEERISLMLGSHAPQLAPTFAHTYVFTIDVGGAAFGSAGPSISLSGNRNDEHHDSTVLTIFELDHTTLADPLLRAPTFRVVRRASWTGADQTTLYAQINAYIENWKPQRIIIDATGVGEGLASFLARSAGQQSILPFKFSQSSKSDLGWKFLSIIETGRFREYALPVSNINLDLSVDSAAGLRIHHSAHATADSLQADFIRQLRFCQMEVLPGPGRYMRWGVPDGTRDPSTGQAVHDDLVLSAALIAALPTEGMGPAESEIVPASDPLAEMTF